MILKIKELDINLIAPNSETMHRPEQGGSKIVVIGKPGTGKCLGKDVPVALWSGNSKASQEIEVGDELQGDDDLAPRVVQSITSGRDELYEVSQGDRGIAYVTNGDHILCLRAFDCHNPSSPCFAENYVDQSLSHVVLEISVRDVIRYPYLLKSYGGYRKGKEDAPYPLSVRSIGEGTYFGFCITGNGRFCLGDGTVTHNTTLITSLLYQKRDIFPIAFIMSGTEDSNGHYKRIVPSTFVYNRLDEKKVEDFVIRQKIAKKHLVNPWAVLLLDDCTDDPRLFNKPLFQGLYKNGRHWKMWFILSLQYCMDIKPVIRTNVDGVFILRESNLRNRKSLWENYAGIVPEFSLFCSILDQITDDYTALYIHNSTTSNKLEDCLFWYKAVRVPSNFKLGSKDFWKYHHHRYNEQYRDPFV